MQHRDPFRVMSVEIGSTAPEEVRTLAACRGSERLMRATNDHRARRALAVCNTCPVLDPCRAWAMENPDPVPLHIAGGMKPSERRTARRRATVTQ